MGGTKVEDGSYPKGPKRSRMQLVGSCNFAF